MKKIGMFMIVGALAWSLQACNNNPNNHNTTDGKENLYDDENMTSPMPDTSSMTPLDTMGDMNRMDTTGTNRLVP